MNMNDSSIEENEGSKRRFDVELFIIHPSIQPEAITAALGLEPANMHRVGDRRKTPKGTLLEGNYSDTRWRYSLRHTITEQWFAHEIAAFVDSLMNHKVFLNQIRSTGGEACVIVHFLGDGYFGDQLTPDILAKLSELNVDLGIECFTIPQS